MSMSERERRIRRRLRDELPHYARKCLKIRTKAGEVVPLVLGAEDRPVLGWWPVTERELLVARGGLLLLGGLGLMGWRYRSA